MGSAPFLKCQTFHQGLLKHGWNPVPNWYLTSWHWVEHCISIEKAILAKYLPSILPWDYLHLKFLRWFEANSSFFPRWLHQMEPVRLCSEVLPLSTRSSRTKVMLRCFLKQENWKKWGPVVCAFPWCCCLMKFLDLAFKMWLFCLQAP